MTISRKTLLLTTLTALPLLLTAAGATAAGAPQEERIHHYEGVEVKSDASAHKVLKDETIAIGEALKKTKLEAADMEKIHERSYSLENAVDKLRADKAAPEAKIDALDEAVQALHFASENHEEAELRKQYKAMKSAIAGL